jgi:RNA polymerase sigma-70 factor (ECF subfamily)
LAIEVVAERPNMSTGSGVSRSVAPNPERGSTDKTAAFTVWYRREAPAMVRAIAVASEHADVAQEVTAEAFARAWADWDRVSAMASPCGWVYRVALNLLRSRLRRAGLERRFAPQIAPPRVVPPPAVPDRTLWSAVRALAPRARMAIALRYVADLPEAEIAVVMGVSRGTVASTLSSARVQLAQALVPEEEGCI